MPLPSFAVEGGNDVLQHPVDMILGRNACYHSTISLVVLVLHRLYHLIAIRDENNMRIPDKCGLI